MLIPALAFANDGENTVRLYLNYPSPNSYNSKGLYTVRVHLDANNLLDVEDFSTLVEGLDQNSFNDMELDGLQYYADRPSETAAYFFRRGERLYRTNKLDKAARAFKSSLRAQDGGLETYSYLYLVHISKRTGDKEQARAYTAKLLQNRPTAVK